MYLVRNPVRLSITNIVMLITANTAVSGGLMSNWKIRAEFYIKANNKDEAWSMATLDLPKDSQIIEIEREGERV